MTVRYIVAWWAGVLEETLQRNDAKPHWSMPTAELLGLLLVAGVAGASYFYEKKKKEKEKEIDVDFVNTLPR